MTFIGILSSSLSKIAYDILLMSQTEIGELEEEQGGRSSTMPRKRNPIKVQQALVAAKLFRSQIQTFLDGMIQDHEHGSAS